MFVSSLRHKMRHLPAYFEAHFKAPHWGTSVWDKDTQRQLVDALNALNVETSTRQDFIDILGKVHADYYLCAETCSVCGSTTYDMISFEKRNSEGDITVHMCGECVKKASSLLSEQ